MYLIHNNRLKIPTVAGFRQPGLVTEDPCIIVYMSASGFFYEPSPLRGGRGVFQYFLNTIDIYKKLWYRESTTEVSCLKCVYPTKNPIKKPRHPKHRSLLASPSNLSTWLEKTWIAQGVCINYNYIVIYKYTYIYIYLKNLLRNKIDHSHKNILKKQARTSFNAWFFIHPTGVKNPPPTSG